MASVFGVVRAMAVGGSRGSVVLTIPADLRNARGFKKGDRFLASLDDKGHIVYQRIGSEKSCERDTATNERPPAGSSTTPTMEVDRSDH